MVGPLVRGGGDGGGGGGGGGGGRGRREEAGGGGRGGGGGGGRRRREERKRLQRAAAQRGQGRGGEGRGGRKEGRGRREERGRSLPSPSPSPRAPGTAGGGGGALTSSAGPLGGASAAAAARDLALRVPAGPSLCLSVGRSVGRSVLSAPGPSAAGQCPRVGRLISPEPGRRKGGKGGGARARHLVTSSPPTGSPPCPSPAARLPLGRPRRAPLPSSSAPTRRETGRRPRQAQALGERKKEEQPKDKPVLRPKNTATLDPGVTASKGRVYGDNNWAVG